MDPNDVKFQKEMAYLQLLASAATTVGAVLLTMYVSLTIFSIDVQTTAISQNMTSPIIGQVVNVAEDKSEILLYMGGGTLFGGLLIVGIRIHFLKHGSNR